MKTKRDVLSTIEKLLRRSITLACTCGVFIALALVQSCSSSIRYSVLGRSVEKKQARDIVLSAPQAGYQQTDPQRQRLIDVAREYIGTPYCFGGEGPKCMDCSAFVRQVYARCNRTLPRTAREMAESLKSSGSVTTTVEAGDLLFFDTLSKGYASHVGIAISSEYMIHASSTGGVRIDMFKSPYYERTFLFSCSVLGLNTDKM